VGLFLSQALQLVLFAAGACASSLLVGGHKKFHGGGHYSTVLALVAACVMAAALVAPRLDDTEMGGGKVATAPFERKRGAGVVLRA
jgi:hypothetical protein